MLTIRPPAPFALVHPHRLVPAKLGLLLVFSLTGDEAISSNPLSSIVIIIDFFIISSSI